MNDSESINKIEYIVEQLAIRNKEKYEWTFYLPGLKKSVRKLIILLQSSMYPGIFGEKACSKLNVKIRINRYLRLSARLLKKILKEVMPEKDIKDIDLIVYKFMGSLGEVSKLLESDVLAAYEGDPAAPSEKEIMLAYPAFEAIIIYRMAHLLYELKVPFIPRMMTEYAHSITGIDIHPGAKIGRFFFIDHGTGVVIGETTVIGEHVKLYQGVTLGAKSFELDELGNPVKNIKRHPEIGSFVVIYAGATILGGDTVIGDNCVIGGNVWLTHSVEAGNKIFYNGDE